MKKAPRPDGGALGSVFSGSTEAATGFGERVFVGGDGFIDRLVRGQIIIFALKLAVEPAGQIAQRLDDRLLGILGHVLPGGAVSLDRDRHAVFVIIIAAMAGLCAKLMEVTALDRLKGIGDAVQFGVLRGVFPDQARRMFVVGVPGFKASTVTL